MENRDEKIGMFSQDLVDAVDITLEDQVIETSELKDEVIKNDLLEDVESVIAPVVEEDTTEEEEESEETEEAELIEDETEQTVFALDANNLVPLLGAEMKKNGVFSEDFEVTAETTQQELYEEYEKSMYETLSGKILGDLQTKLSEEGITDQHLKYAKILDSGATDEKAQVVKGIVQFDKYSKMEFNSTDDESNVNMVKDYLYDTNTSSKKVVENLLKTALLDEDEFEELFVEAKDHYKNKKERVEQDALEEAENVKAVRSQIIQNNQRVIENTIKSGQVLKTKIPNIKKFESGIRDNTEEIQIRDERRLVSKLGKFLIEFNNSPELQLWAFNQHLFGEEIIEGEKEKSKNEGETNLLSHFETVKQKGISQKIKTNLNQNSKVKTHLFKI